MASLSQASSPGVHGGLPCARCGCICDDSLPPPCFRAAHHEYPFNTTSPSASGRAPTGSGRASSPSQLPGLGSRPFHSFESGDRHAPLDPWAVPICILWARGRGPWGPAPSLGSQHSPFPGKDRKCGFYVTSGPCPQVWTRLSCVDGRGEDSQLAVNQV